MTLVLETLGSDQTLDLGGLGVGLLALTLGLDLTADDVLPDLYSRKNGIILASWQSISHTLPSQLPGLSATAIHRAGEDGIVELVCTYIVFLGETEEAADLGGALGTEALGVDDVGKAGNVGLADLDDGESKDGKIGGDDAATDGLSLTLTSTAGAVAGVTLGEQEADTGRVHNTLLHGETLLVVTAGDADDVALPLVAEGVSGDLSAHLLSQHLSAFSVTIAATSILY